MMTGATTPSLTAQTFTDLQNRKTRVQLRKIKNANIARVAAILNPNFMSAVLYSLNALAVTQAKTNKT